MFYKTVLILTPLSILMIACGGGGGSSVNPATTGPNQPPVAPTITSLTPNPLTLHPFTVSLTATDPDGDSVSFLVNGNAISGSTFTLTPTTAGPLSLSVVAKDSRGAVSVPTTYSTTIQANHVPAITTPSSFTFSSTTTAFDQTVQVTASDADGDEVVLSLNGAPAYTNERGEAILGVALTLSPQTNGASLRFQGTVPTGSATARVQVPLLATDRVPGTTTMVGSTGSQSLGISYSNSANNHAPSAPTIIGPTTALTLHPAFYALSSVDPDGDPTTFTVTGTGFTGTGNSAKLVASAAGAAVITVVARDSKNATSPASSLTVQVAANRAPQFISQPTGQMTGASSTINWNSFLVVAQDPDTDDVQFSLTGTPSFIDNDGAGVSGCSVSINPSTGLVSFTGTVPPGKASVTAVFTVQAVDVLPGTTTILGATATQVVSLTYRH